MKKWLLLLFLLLLAGFVGLAVTARELHQPYRGYSANQLLTIEPGLRAPEVADLLGQHGILEHRWPFLLRYWLGRWRHERLKAGEYLFDRPLSPAEVYKKLAHGDIYLHSVVIPEGSDQFDVARILSQQIGMKPEEFLRAASETAVIRGLDQTAPSLEGYLFPDTYRLPRNVTPAGAAAAMLGRFRHVLDTHLEVELRGSERRLHDVIALASLVEKETPDPEERPIIAGVFARRIDKGWPLECDPTVVYALRLAHHQLERPAAPITQGDLKFDSPYNTYRHAGLPPGPICNPGEASIRAALHPAPGKFLYFVSNNHGGHFFARTLAEHQRNVARYRRDVAALRAPAPKTSPPAKRSVLPVRRGGENATSNSTQREQRQK